MLHVPTVWWFCELISHRPLHGSKHPRPIVDFYTSTNRSWLNQLELEQAPRPLRLTKHVDVYHPKSALGTRRM